MNHFTTFLRREMGASEQQDFAARLGISASQLTKLLHNEPCKRDTVAKIAAGISSNKRTRAQCVAAFLRDYATLAGDAGDLIRIRVI